MNFDQSVLICDDDESIRRLVTAILKPEGYDLRQASDVPSTLAALAEAAPDLLILDVNVPGEGGGRAILDHVRRDPALDGVRVLLVTGVVEAREQDWGRSLGADDHLIKPFELDVLRSTVRGLVAG